MRECAEIYLLVQVVHELLRRSQDMMQEHMNMLIQNVPYVGDGSRINGVVDEGPAFS